MSEAIVSMGWYGKLPCQGDFVWRRLPQEFIRPWDAWLQQGMVCMRAELGEADWLARYLVAPIRRFWLAPGLLGETGWIGLLMPSIDRVGRHFPLTLAVATAAILPQRKDEPLTAAMSSLALALASAPWLASLDQAARKVLDVEFTVEQFESALAVIAPIAMRATHDAAAVEQACELLAGGPGEPAVASIWWCEDAVQASQYLRFGALPPPEAFCLLLSDPALVPDANPMP